MHDNERITHHVDIITTKVCITSKLCYTGFNISQWAFNNVLYNNIEFYLIIS